VTSISAISTIVLAWRGEVRKAQGDDLQAEELRLKIQQLQLQLDEARSKIRPTIANRNDG
jgi:hypothetical protein